MVPPGHVPIDVARLKAEQVALAPRVRTTDDHGPVQVVAGFDVAYTRERAFGALVEVAADGGNVLDVHVAATPIAMPYIPGLLAFREFPVLARLWPQRRHDPDVLLIDGGGILHPRRIGIASYAGVKLDVPTVGITKKLLLGEVEGEVTAYEDVAPLRHEGELVGHAYLSSPRAKNPIYVSPGHRVGHDTALHLVQGLCTGAHKLPVPLQRADQEAGRAKRSMHP